MGSNCWNEYGRLDIDNEAVHAAVPLIAEVYNHHEAGGGLHIVLDDWNLEDHFVSFCQEYIKTDAYMECCSQEQIDADRQCCVAFANMTIEERASALTRYEKSIV